MDAGTHMVFALAQTVAFAYPKQAYPRLSLAVLRYSLRSQLFVGVCAAGYVAKSDATACFECRCTNGPFTSCEAQILDLTQTDSNICPE